VFVEFCLLFVVAPALILGIAAQFIVRSTFARAQAPTIRASGFAVVRKMLDAAGLEDVRIEQIPGTLNDQYDARSKVLRLSADVFHGQSLAALGIAAHESGHALQHQAGYLPLVVRGIAIPAALYGSPCGLLLVLSGVVYQPLLVLGTVLFGAAVALQLISLPVEFDASRRALRELVDLELVEGADVHAVGSVLNASALAGLAVTLQSLVTVTAALFRFLRVGVRK
jgi:Zn-dependent membrane protease YugP